MMIYLEAAVWWLLEHPSVVAAVTVSVAGGLLASIVVRLRAGGEHVCRLVDRPGAGWDAHPEELAGLVAEVREQDGAIDWTDWATLAASYRKACGLAADEPDTAGEVVRVNVVRPGFGLAPVPPAASGDGEPAATGRCRICGGAAVHRPVVDGAWWTHVEPAGHRVVVDPASVHFAGEPVDEDLEATRRLSWAAYGLGHAMPPPGGEPGGIGGGYTGRHQPGSGAVTW